MKYLRMKPIELGTQSTADIVKIVVNDIPQGCQIDEMRIRLRIAELADRANGTLALEDADAKLLQRSVAGMKWAKVHPGIVEFADAVAGMTDTPTEHE